MSEMPKLDPAVKAEWLRRLRSGEYKQGRNFLRVEGRYCCLGVLCGIAAEAGKGFWRDKDQDRVSRFVCGVDSADQVLPSEITSWAVRDPEWIDNTLRVPCAEVRRVVPELQTDFHNDTVTLDYLNDNGYTFEQIARVIEACL